jgi:hypothetical protein
METFEGYIFFFDDPARNEILRGRAQSKAYFTDTFNRSDLSLPSRKPKLCFLSFGNQEISYAALVSQRNAVVTAKHSVKFYEFIPLSPPITLDTMSQITGIIFTLPVSGYSKQDWFTLINFIKETSPNSATEITRLELLASSESDFNQDNFDIVAQQKDAVGLALKIFGGDFEQELSRMNLTTEPAPFLQGMTHALLSEDAMINHDTSVFGDEWKQQNRYQIDAAEFFNEKGEKLTIMNANRKGIERVLGIDLLYYHHHFSSFVMVQYKRMLKESQEFVFRPDNQCVKEIRRMKTFENEHIESRQIQGLEDYRLNSGIFFLKLCPAISFEPLSSELIKGMYLPLEYWDILEIASSTKSSQGRVKITFNNVGRHMNSTLFVQLLQSGWIGSRIKRTQVLSQLIKQLLEEGNSVVLASSETPGKRQRQADSLVMN